MKWPWQNPYEPSEPPPGPRLVIMPGGAMVDQDWAEAEALKAQARERSLEAQAKARREVAQVEFEEAERNRREREEAFLREAPRGFGGGA